MTRPHQIKSRQTTQTRQESRLDKLYKSEHTEKRRGAHGVGPQRNPTTSEGQEWNLMPKGRQKSKGAAEASKKNIKVSKGTPKRH